MQLSKRLRVLCRCDGNECISCVGGGVGTFARRCVISDTFAKPKKDGCVSQTPQLLGAGPQEVVMKKKSGVRQSLDFHLIWYMGLPKIEKNAISRI